MRQMRQQKGGRNRFPALCPRRQKRFLPPFLVRAIFCLLILACVICLPGCAAWRGCFYHKPVCVLTPDATAAEIMAHLNANVTKLSAWRSTDVKIRVSGPGGLPVLLSAVLAVESPRKMRLMVNSLAGNEFDMGSNPDRFWFWMRRGEPRRVLTASHEQMAVAQQRLQIPFEPDWVIEALGVIPIDPEKTTLQKPGLNSRIVHLVSQRVSPQGHLLRKVIVVDTCQGVVVEHVLYDANGGLIAKASFGDHRADAASGVVLPRRIKLHWPQTGMALTMDLRNIEVNPRAMPDQTWQLPHYPNYPLLDIGR